MQRDWHLQEVQQFRQEYLYVAISHSHEQEELEGQQAFEDIHALITEAANGIVSKEQLLSHCMFLL
jgi:hypothetical protein